MMYSIKRVNAINSKSTAYAMFRREDEPQVQIGSSGSRKMQGGDAKTKHFVIPAAIPF
jgi:hypothetical protein